VIIAPVVPKLGTYWYKWSD